MGASQRKKGRGGEIELSKILNEHGIPATPGNPLNFGKIPDVVGVDGIHVEVKRVEKLNVGEAMNQAIRDSMKFRDGMPALFHRRNRQPWLVTMRLDDWLKLYKGVRDDTD